MTSQIIRIAAKGDGVTNDGRHIPGTAPGDVIAADGNISQRGSHYQQPPCRHFGRCGGCQLQQLDEASLASFVHDRVANAMAGQGLEADRLAAPHLSAPHSRRRASLQAIRKGRVEIGFREAGSHRLVDLAQCDVMHPALFAVLDPLRRLLGNWPGKSIAPAVELALVDQGVDLALRPFSIDGLAAIEALGDFARANRLARLTVDQGYGAETHWEPEPATVTLSGVAVAVPCGAFLQATVDSEAALVAAAKGWLGEARFIADLFSGLGTFAFALAVDGRKVLAAEADRAAHLACKSAAGTKQRQVFTQHRDLFRNPLLPDELNRFDAVLLDPPRAGAREQVERLAQSTVQRIVYISCNPSSWARDAALLTGAGWRLAEVRPVGQFRWSTHVELASYFTR